MKILNNSVRYFISGAALLAIIVAFPLSQQSKGSVSLTVQTAYAQEDTSVDPYVYAPSGDTWRNGGGYTSGGSTTGDTWRNGGGYTTGYTGGGYDSSNSTGNSSTWGGGDAFAGQPGSWSSYTGDPYAYTGGDTWNIPGWNGQYTNGCTSCGYTPSTYSTPAYSSPTYSTPTYQQYTYTTPTYSTPIYTQPVYRQPVYSQPIAYQQPAQPTQIVSNTDNSNCKAGNCGNSVNNNYNNPVNNNTNNNNVPVTVTIANPAPAAAAPAQNQTQIVYQQPPAQQQVVYQQPQQPVYHYNPPVAYNNPGPYVALSKVPYTGLDLGPFGTAIYWSILVLAALIGAYLITVKKVQNKIATSLKSFLFGTKTAQVAQVQTASVPSAAYAAPAPATSSMDEFIFSQINRARA